MKHISLIRNEFILPLAKLHDSIKGKNTVRYITEKQAVPEVWCSVPGKVTQLENGTAQIEVRFTEPGAAMIFFGA